MHVERYLKRMKAKREGNDYWINLEKGELREVIKHLKSLGVYRISSISGVDVGEKIEVIYHFIHKDKTINLRISVNKKRCEVESITDVYPGANLFERELYEMLGIRIRNHPNLKKLFLSEDSPKNPLRRT